jgi:murein L,D-transpeptidase YafK
VVLAGLAAAVAGLVAACGSVDLAPHLRPLPKETVMLLGKKGMDAQAPIFIRIFKEESELEVWKQREDGRFYHFKTYPICNWSGELGPKLRYADMQAPEGFYTVTREQMNPDSKYHLAFNIGYPNAYDRAHGRTGEHLMVHGKCQSAGCYAITDALMEELYAIAREAFIGGQEAIHVHAFPFRMTEANMARHAQHRWYGFWRTLKEGYDYFELTRQPPTVAVCGRRYLVNVRWRGGDIRTLDPAGPCPRFERPKPERFIAKAGQQAAEERVVEPGPKLRAASIDSAPRSGLTTTRAPNNAWWSQVLPSMGFAAGK